MKNLKTSSRILALMLLAGAMLTASSLRAQSDCAQTLLDAEKNYYNGQFNKIAPGLASCLEDGFDVDQKVEANRLIALSHIFSKRFEPADSAVLNMLRLNPQYRHGPLDPPELESRIRKFEIFPKFSLSAQIGSHHPFFSVNKVYNIRNIPSDVSYKGSTGTHFGVSGSYYLRKNLMLSLDLERRIYNFDIVDKNVVTEVRLEEEHKRNSFGFSVGYLKSIEMMDLHFSGGLAFNKLKSSTANIYKLEQEAGSEYTNNPDPNAPTYAIIYREDLNFSNMYHRNSTDFRPFLRIMSSFLLKSTSRVELYARYEIGTANMTKDREIDTEQILKFEWVEDDFTANYLSIGVRYTRLFYSFK